MESLLPAQRNRPGNCARILCRLYSRNLARMRVRSVSSRWALASSRRRYAIRQTDFRPQPAGPIGEELKGLETSPNTEFEFLAIDALPRKRQARQIRDRMIRGLRALNSSPACRRADRRAILRASIIGTIQTNTPSDRLEHRPMCTIRFLERWKMDNWRALRSSVYRIFDVSPLTHPTSARTLAFMGPILNTFPSVR